MKSIKFGLVILFLGVVFSSQAQKSHLTTESFKGELIKDFVNQMMRNVAKLEKSVGMDAKWHRTRDSVVKAMMLKGDGITDNDPSVIKDLEMRYGNTIQKVRSINPNNSATYNKKVVIDVDDEIVSKKINNKLEEYSVTPFDKLESHKGVGFMKFKHSIRNLEGYGNYDFFIIKLKDSNGTTVKIMVNQRIFGMYEVGNVIEYNDYQILHDITI